MSAQPARDASNPAAPDWGVDYGLRDLWNEVAPGLFVGGTADHDTVDYGQPRLRFGMETIQPETFDAVVTMYAWARPVGWGVEELRWGIMDGPDGVDLEQLRETVVWAHRRWQAGRRVLVRCQAGLNRSSLVVALVLVRDGLEPQQAIDLIRDKRSGRALFNEEFVRIIHGEPEYWRA